jgi:4'-phosphopantetheinyl transferase
MGHEFPADELQVWQAEADDPLWIARAPEILNAEELGRAERFHFAADRERFLTGRAFLRSLLGECVSLRPSEVPLRVSLSGKPELDPDRISDPEDAALRFNLSHSGQCVLVVLAWGREVGVDVETTRAYPDVHELARRYFTATESALLDGLDVADATRVFLAIWARKEAVLKAMGTGLSGDLSSFNVGGYAERAAVVETIEGQDTRRWTVHSFVMAEGMFAAVAYAGEGLNLRTLRGRA